MAGNHDGRKLVVRPGAGTKRYQWGGGQVWQKRKWWRRRRRRVERESPANDIRSDCGTVRNQTPQRQLAECAATPGSPADTAARSPACTATAWPGRYPERAGQGRRRGRPGRAPGNDGREPAVAARHMTGDSTPAGIHPADVQASTFTFSIDLSDSGGVTERQGRRLASAGAREHNVVRSRGRAW